MIKLTGCVCRAREMKRCRRRTSLWRRMASIRAHGVPNLLCIGQNVPGQCEQWWQELRTRTSKSKLYLANSHRSLPPMISGQSSTTPLNEILPIRQSSTHKSQVKFVPFVWRATLLSRLRFLARNALVLSQTLIHPLVGTSQIYRQQIDTFRLRRWDL